MLHAPDIAIAIAIGIAIAIAIAIGIAIAIAIGSVPRVRVVRHRTTAPRRHPLSSEPRGTLSG
jgi:hypothetical protein